MAKKICKGITLQTKKRIVAYVGIAGLLFSAMQNGAQVYAEETVVPQTEVTEVIADTATAKEGTIAQAGFVVETQYDKSIFVENGIEFHYIAGDTWQGIMMVVPDASRVFVGTPHDTYNGAAGGSATTIARRYGAIAAVNGAFFVDTNYHGNGGTPIGFVFSEGKQKYGGSGSVYNLIGLDQNNKLVCGSMSGAQAVAAGVRDAVTCNPLLVVDGAVANLSSKSTTLRDARTAVGARADGAFLLLTIDGRMPHSIGATTQEEADVMLAFGAIGAGNLDGGGSLSFYYAGSPIAGLSSAYGSRPAPNAFCVRPE